MVVAQSDEWSAVQIPTSANFYLPIVNKNRKDENKEKRGRERPIFKNKFEKVALEIHQLLRVKKFQVWSAEWRQLDIPPAMDQLYMQPLA